MGVRQHDGSEGRAHAPPPRHLSRDRSHARVYKFWYKLAAWRSLTSRGRDLVTAVLAAYHPDHANAFELTDGKVSALLGCSKNTSRKVFHECVERGWFVIESGGRMNGALCTRGRIVSLACYETETRRAEPTRYENWKPKKSETAQNLVFSLKPI